MRHSDEVSVVAPPGIRMLGGLSPAALASAATVDIFDMSEADAIIEIFGDLDEAFDRVDARAWFTLAASSASRGRCWRSGVVILMAKRTKLNSTAEEMEPRPRWLETSSTSRASSLPRATPPLSLGEASDHAPEERRGRELPAEARVVALLHVRHRREAAVPRAVRRWRNSRSCSRS